ncbi:alcohol dehydrogenase [Aspergillus japonicus CBS 114.51]|uniref:Alcohol dehydrogenase n=1 Tax=Aspergillus japonicus CBS 114.51 TaxID=1448312 RepID=A0A8T8X8U7_ASPJA|nr:alcohol dehydrogenase [Aspergillus japonicus CBS 114.51]RAH84558.1 alcohol dehydrogenase [Aspergillus japonicus CBS 114.51]
MTTTNSQTGLYVDDTLSFSVQKDLPIPKPDAGEILVETLYSGINPADIKHATQLGITPAVLGYDFCGKVLETAPQCHRFRPGDIVAGYTPTGLSRPAKYGTHQAYLVCPEEMAFRVPAALPLPDAAALTVVAMTAADALFNLFGIRPPQETKTGGAPDSKGILIWGASSSVGLCAVQLARASGVSPIFVTASAQRHALLTELGATHCFDYRSATVVGEIRESIEKSSASIAYGLDAVGSRGTESEKSSAALLARCLPAEANLVSLVVQDDPRFRMPLATPNRDVTIKVAAAPRPITILARPADHECAWRVLEWAVRHYGVRFRLPRVEVFRGSAEAALEELRGLAEGGRGFGKVVLGHPLS